MASNGDGLQVLLSSEAEAYIEAFNAFDIKEIGSPRFYLQHEYLERLNMQAVISASKDEDEFVKEFFISFEKIPVLIHDLITTEIWKQKVFPELIRVDREPDLVFPLYTVLYHEAIVVNLLETLLFHQEACQSAGDAIVDLIDFCYRKLTHLTGTCLNRSDDDNDELDITTISSKVSASTVEELENQEEKLKFSIAIKTISILSYIINHLSSLPLACSERILNTHDVPLLFVQLIESSPWTREKSGTILKFADSKWQKVATSDRFVLVKTEGQVWISIFQLLLTGENRGRYELTSYKKGILLRMRPYLSEILLDQIPSLIELQRYLDQLAIMDPPSVKRDLILEQVPEIWDRIMKTYEGQWVKIAQKQNQLYFNASNGNLRHLANRLAETYSMDAFENLITEPPKCGVCGQLATKRCSRCANEWYCSRECQVAHWPKHKKSCNLMYEATQTIRNSEQVTKS